MQQQQFFTEKFHALGIELNKVQKEAVLKIDGPLLLLASPGSGKTTTIIMRIGYMVEVLGIHPARIKAVTFSKASARDMKERFEKWFPHLPMVDFSTIHSLAFQIVRGAFASRGQSFGIIEDGGTGGQFVSKKMVLRQIFERVNKSQITEDQLEELVTYISFVKNRMLSEKDWNLKQFRIKNKVKILREYEAFKARGTGEQLIDFDDMLLMAHAELVNNREVLARYQGMFDYVLTDESQDTSLIQHAIIELLVAKHRNLCVVADEDQSIYSWRGADPQYLLNFKQVYPEGEVLMMTMNYRSQATIVKVADQFIRQNKNRYNKQMTTPNEEQEPIQFVDLPDYIFQANYIAQKVKEQREAHSVAVLYRHNFSAIPLMDELDREGIPFMMKDSTIRFFTHWVTEDVLNFMRFSYNIRNVAQFEKIARKMQGYFTKKQLDALMRVHGDSDVFTKLLEVPELKDYQKDIVRRLRKTFSEIKFDTTSASEMMRHIRLDFGYEKVLKNMAEQFGFHLDSLLDVLNVLEMIAEHTPTMRDFAARLKELESLAKSSYVKKPNAVTLSTLHSSKGLEFEEVFIIDVIDGILPAGRKQVEFEEDEEQELSLTEKKEKRALQAKEEALAFEEEVRLFYVGMTRARRYLSILSYSKRFKTPVGTSRFVPQLKRIVNPNMRAVAEPVRVVRKEKLHPRAIVDVNQLAVGDVVEHVTLGAGEILRLGDGAIEIVFERNRVPKKFMIDICLQHGYLLSLK